MHDKHLNIPTGAVATNGTHASDRRTLMGHIQWRGGMVDAPVVSPTGNAIRNHLCLCEVVGERCLLYGIEHLHRINS